MPLTYDTETSFNQLKKMVFLSNNFNLSFIYLLKKKCVIREMGTQFLFLIKKRNAPSDATNSFFDQNLIFLKST